jgi:flagellar M-ring protein FliF
MAGSALSQLSALNKSLTLNQKLSIVGLGVVILFGVLLFGYLVQRQPYQLLFSDLDASNANSVVEQLKQLGIPYELANGGRSILVPADRVSETRLELASQSLPKSGRIGLELFDQNNWGISDFAQKVNYARALEGELERTILSLSEVSGARVHLVMQKDSLFEEDSQPAKASVVIKLNSTATLGKRKVAAIRNLVAFAVEGLDAKNVTLVDVSGNLLSEPPEEDESLTTAQVGLRQKAEKEVCDKVRAILAPIVGEGNVRVSASVQMDFSQTTEKSESIQDPIIISQQVSKELVNSPEQQGIPFKANDPAAASTAQAGPASSQNGRSRQTETTNYEVSKTVRQTVRPSGSILQQSVAVVVNDKQVATADGQGTEMQGRSPQEMERIRNLVTATVGLNAQRGDTLTVENVSFTLRPEDLPTVPTPSFWQRNWDLIHPALRYLLILVVFALFYLMIFRPVKNRVFSYVEVEKVNNRQLAASIKDPELLKQLESALSGDRALGEGELLHKPTDPESAMRKEILRLAKDDPQAVTHLIRSWLSEGV